MNAARQRAYLVLLAASLVHIKWDLACWYGGYSWLLPWRSRSQRRTAQRAAYRSAAFHNLAIYSSRDFAGFSEEMFWRDIEKFYQEFPDSRWANYRGLFEHCLRGEEVTIIRPGG